ncbi:MAG: electron transport complex subunit RsxG [Wenzhouxiangellaceae bacterium]
MTRRLLYLLLIALAAATLLAGVDRLTRERIVLQEQRRALALLNQVIPADSYDNELVSDRYTAWIAGLDGPATIYRARRNGDPVALVADVTTAEGYAGPIRLLVGINPQGRVLAVRVVAHQETPGLGDRIEAGKSDWIRQFQNRGIDDPPPDRWKPDRRGGEFDTITSATISSSAVISAVARVLAWYRDTGLRAFEIKSEQKT